MSDDRPLYRCEVCGITRVSKADILFHHCPESMPFAPRLPPPEPPGWYTKQAEERKRKVYG